MYSTITNYRIETHREDLAAFAAERRLARSAMRQPAEPAQPTARTQPARVPGTLAASHHAAMVMFAVLAVLIALAVPVLATPLV